MKSKKALELAISTLILIVLGVFVLIGLVYVITGGFEIFKRSTEPFQDTIVSSSIKQACSLACSNTDKLTYCCEEYEIDDEKIKCFDERLEVECSLNCQDYSCNPQDDTNLMTAEECNRQGGVVFASPGDTSHIERCRELNGEIIGSIPFGIEGAICCKYYYRLTAEKLDFYGRSLARWASTQCVTVRINNLFVNTQGPNAGGCSPALYVIGNGYEDILRASLERAIEESSCNINNLDSYFNNLNDALESIDYSLTKEQLAQDLSCLGEFEFTPTEFGPE